MHVMRIRNAAHVPADDRTCTKNVQLSFRTSFDGWRNENRYYGQRLKLCSGYLRKRIFKKAKLLVVSPRILRNLINQNQTLLWIHFFIFLPDLLEKSISKVRYVQNSWLLASIKVRKMYSTSPFVLETLRVGPLFAFIFSPPFIVGLLWTDFWFHFFTPK